MNPPPTTLGPNGEGIGVDLVRVSRFEAHLDDHRFLERVFSPREVEDAGSGPSRAARLAVRWAAKEACAKALGTGIGEHLGWRDIEIQRTATGAPAIVLGETALARHGDPSLLLSMSHDGEYAIAMVWVLHRSSTNRQG